MTEPLTRDRIIELLRELPADATIDDAIEKLVFIAQIERGIAELDAGQGVPHDEVKRRFKELVAGGCDPTAGRARRCVRGMAGHPPSPRNGKAVDR